MFAAAEKRAKQDPIPHNLKDIVSDFQMAAIRSVESYGGELLFVRRPLFQDVVPVVRVSGSEDLAVVEADGSLNTDHGYIFRP